jgi:transposase
MPWCNTEAMNQHLREISREVDPGTHAVLILDQAGWHSTPKLTVPDNITLLFLPPKSPELNPVENIWQTVCSLCSRPRLARVGCRPKARSKCPPGFAQWG